MNKKLLLLGLLTFLLLILTACDKSVKIISDENENGKVLQNNISKNTDGIDINGIEFTNKGFERVNVLTVATSSLSGEFNPITYDNIYDEWISRMIFDGLISTDRNGCVNNNAIAEKWEISEDKLTYTFYIKEGILFHDGKELTSSDVEFTYYTLADPDYDFSRGSEIDDIVGVVEYRNNENDNISGIKIIDEYTISFTVVTPNVKKIRDFSFGILPKHYYNYDDFEEFKLLASKPMGSGIMKLKKYENDKYIELEVNKEYFKVPAKIDGVIVKLIPLEIQAVAISSGEVDIANPSANIVNYEIMKNSKIVNIQEFIENAYRCIGLNLRLDKFKDKRVRQALAYGIRMNDYIETQWKGFATACYSPVSPISWASPDLSKLNKYDYDIGKARKLLAEAGWVIDDDGKLMKNGEQFIINWTTYKDAEWSLNLIAIAKNNWGELGIKVVENVMEFDDATEEIFNKQNFEVFNIRWMLSVDPDPYELFYSENDKLGEFNVIGFHNDKADEIIKLARAEYDKEKRVELYQEWAEIANEELPYLYVSIGTTIWGVNDRVKNLKLGPYYDWVSCLSDIELEY